MKHVNLSKSLVWVATAALVALSAASGKAQLVGMDLGIQGDTAYTGTGVFGESFTEVGAPAGKTYEQGYLGGTDPYNGDMPPAVSLPGGITLKTATPDGLVAGEANQGGYASEQGGGLVFQSNWNLEGAVPANNTYNGVLQFTLSGLAANTVFSIAGYGDQGPITFTTDLGSFDLAGSGGSSSFLLGQNYTIFTGLTDGSGNLVIDYTGGPGSNGYTALSALSIDNPLSVAVPEPSTWAMMVAGLGSLVFFVRRRAKVQSLR
jgi:hypothetical protein